MKNNCHHRLLKPLLSLAIILFMCFSASAVVTGTADMRIFHNSSPTANSKITYMISLSNGWSQGISSVTGVSVKNLETGNSVYTSTSSSNVPYGTLPISLSPALYEFTFVVSTKEFKSFVSVTIVKNIWVGNKTQWANCFDMEPGISQYSMKRYKATVGQTYSYAQSFNELPASTYGWVEMQKLNSNMNDSRVYMVVEPLTDPRTFTPTSNVSYLEFYRDNSGNSGIKVRYKQTNGVYRDSVITVTGSGIAATDRVRFVRNANNTCVLQVNDATTTKFSFPSSISGAIKITLLTKQLNDQADNIVSSYAYPSTNYPISTDFESALSSNSGMGTVTTRISPLSGFSSPYNYFITDAPMDDMKSIYKYLKDSVYTQGVDSTTFFQGAVAGTSNTSQLLPAGTYYSNVFDSKGVRIFTNRHDLKPTSIMGQRNQILEEYNEYLSASPDAYVTFDTYLTESDRATLSYSFPNTSPDQIVGVLAEYDVINGGTTWYGKIKYGFYIQNGLYQTIVNGALSSTASINANEECKLVFENGNVYFYKNGSLIRTETAPSTYDYRSAAYTKSWGVLINFLPTGTKFRPYKIGVTVTDNACDKNSGDLAITFSGYQGASVSGVNFSLKNITADPANPTTVYSNITTNTTYGDLASGVYLLEGQLTVGGNTHTNIRRVIYVGSKLSWDPYTNIQTWPFNNAATNYAISTSSVTANNSARAISTNRLDASTAGWMVFTMQGTPVSHGRRTLVSLSEAPMMASLNTFDQFMPCAIFSGGLCMTATNATVGTVFVSPLAAYVPNVPFMISRLSNGSVQYRQDYSSTSPNGILRTVTNYTNGRFKPAFFTQYPSLGIRDAVTNFTCKPYNTDMYAQLKYEMDGYYHIMKNGEIKFVFDQEYDDANLTFNLYNSEDILIKTQADFPAVGTTHGMNYKTILVRDSYCIGSGFFYLEFINSKKEKMYLRFYNDYTGCTPSEVEGGH